jgi:hypothetical protein
LLAALSGKVWGIRDLKGDAPIWHVGLRLGEKAFGRI